MQSQFLVLVTQNKQSDKVFFFERFVTYLELNLKVTAWPMELKLLHSQSPEDSTLGCITVFG